MNLIANITRRVKLPGHLHFKPDTIVTLNYKRVARVQDLQETDLELFIKIKNGEKELVLETDCVIHEDELPNLARNAKAWEKVRELVASGIPVVEAYYELALDSLMRNRGWKFSYEEEDGPVSNVGFSIERPRDVNVAASVDPVKMRPFLTDDEQEEEEAAIQKEIARAQL